MKKRGPDVNQDRQTPSHYVLDEGNKIKYNLIYELSGDH